MDYFTSSFKQLCNAVGTDIHLTFVAGVPEVPMFKLNINI